jgi:REP element-mobilizing transposase RayT
MPRQPRSLLGDGTFHVILRGNRRQPIALDINDCLNLRRLIAITATRFDVEIEAVCLIPNHLHLQVTARQLELSRAMHWFATCYAIGFNRRHRLDGHLFQDRFTTRLITNVEQYREVAVYIALNPVAAGLCSHPAAWVDSTYAATVGRRRPLPSWLSVAWLERAFECRLPGAIRAFEELVEERLLEYTARRRAGTVP